VTAAAVVLGGTVVALWVGTRLCGASSRKERDEERRR
jgi:hypothetical protein